MTFTMATPAIVRGKTKPPIRLIVKPRVDGPSIMRFVISDEAMDRYFDGAKDGDNFNVFFGTDVNKGQAVITKATKGGAVVKKIHPCGTCAINVIAWRGWTSADVKSTPCKILEEKDGGIIIMLPDIGKTT